nr:hypothetical protein [uncultured Pseudomonas sp.]
MKIQSLFVLVALVLSHQASADEVIREVPDTTAGKGVGVLSGVMAGGAAGGPVGALVGGAAGFFLGSAAQHAAGLSERGYEVAAENGEVYRVRSPKSSFAAGDEVTYGASRIHHSRH